MNLTQNDRLKRVTSDTLIVGVDVGSQTHFCRAFDWRGFELSRRVFKFSNTGMGFLTFLRWTEELMNKTEMKKVIVGCEPTGCYWLTFQKFFPEYFECYAEWDSTSGLMLLKEAPLPQDILKIGAGGINQIWRDAKVRAAGIKRAQTLVEAAQNSVGLEAGEAARLEIWVLVNDYILKAEQLKRLDEYLEEKVKEVPNVEKLLVIKGVGMSTVIGFIAEVGDIGRFTDPKQIQKLAGLEIVKKSSGKKKGQPRISKRGRRKLRRTMYESARALMQWNPAFQDVFLYYRNRTRKPLGSMQAKIAVACKAIRVFYVVLQTGCDFDEEKFRKDIIRPEAA